MSEIHNKAQEYILSLTREELEALDNQTLEEYREILHSASSADDIEQLSLKILINSLYGALANQYFLITNPDLAAAITASGRFFIRLLAHNIEARLQAMLPSTDPYLISGDTDSVVHDSLLTLENEKIKIGDLFDRVDSEVEITKNGSEVKKIKGLKSLTYNQEKGAFYSPVNYIMRHKVKKKLYKITSGKNTVTVTEDHSVKIIRDGKLIDVKPYDIIKGDEIVMVIDNE